MSAVWSLSGGKRKILAGLALSTTDAAKADQFKLAAMETSNRRKPQKLPRWEQFPRLHLPTKMQIVHK